MPTGEMVDWAGGHWPWHCLLSGDTTVITCDRFNVKFEIGPQTALLNFDFDHVINQSGVAEREREARSEKHN